MSVFKKHEEEAKVFQDFFPNLLHVCEGKPKISFSIFVSCLKKLMSNGHNENIFPFMLSSYLILCLLVMSKDFHTLPLPYILDSIKKNEVSSFYVFLKNFSMIPIFLIP